MIFDFYSQVAKTKVNTAGRTRIDNETEKGDQNKRFNERYNIVKVKWEKQESKEFEMIMKDKFEKFGGNINIGEVGMESESDIDEDNNG